MKKSGLRFEQQIKTRQEIVKGMVARQFAHSFSCLW